MASILAGVGVAKTVGTAVEAVGNVLDRLFTSDDERLTHDEVRARLLLQPHLAQVEVNKLEAQHRTIFVAGWRPFIGWVCGTALLYHFIVRDLIIWAFLNFAPDLSMPPQLDMAQLVTILLGMLGLGAMRSGEKLMGVAK